MMARKSVAVVLGVLACLSIVVIIRGSSPKRYVAPVRVGEYSSRPNNPRFVEAAGKGDIDAVKRMMAHGVSPNAVDGSTDGGEGEALEAAVAEGHLDVVGLLLDNGADINAPDFWGGTALVSASVAGQTDVVRLLLSRGADVDAEDDGATSLGYAQHMGHRDVVSLLEAAGAR